MSSPFWRHLPSIVWKRRPIQLTFFVTRKCNARCPFCFYLASADREEDHGRELALWEVERIARSLGSLLWLAFSGGEPFLRPDIVEISRAFYAHNRPAILLYSSNGFLPRLVACHTEQILRACPQSRVVVKLSLDGIGPDHDALRGSAGGFARVMQSYRALAGLLDRYPNFELGFNTVLCPQNQDRIDGIIDFVRRLPESPPHTVSLARGQLADSRYLETDLHKYRAAADRLSGQLRGERANLYRFPGACLKAAQDVLQRRLIAATRRAQRRLIPCYAGRLNLVLTETGEVHPCEMRTQSLGNVRQYGYDLRRLAADRPAREALDDIGRGRCHCTHECYFITNILFSPRLYPALAREYLRLARSQVRRTVPSRAR